MSNYDTQPIVGLAGGRRDTVRLMPEMDDLLTWPAVLNQLVAGVDLSIEQASWAMNEVMTGAVSAPRLAGFLMGLRAKGETVEELAGLTAAMLANAALIDVPGPTVDIVGTGGDRARTVNISTMAAIVLAGAGLRVVKHGNRAASSASGSADVLEALGIRLDHSPERVVEIAQEAGITFCFATVFHPAMRHAGVARKELAIPTAFNFLGPLTNPAQTRATAVGSSDARMAELMAGVFARRGTNALVFRGDDGLDELAATGGSSIWEVRDREVEHHHIDLAAQLGLTRIDKQDLVGADPEHNARVAREVIEGTERGPIRETVLANAAAAIVADGSLLSDPDASLVDRLREAYRIAEESIDSGAALAALDRWRAAAAE